MQELHWWIYQWQGTAMDRANILNVIAVQPVAQGLPFYHFSLFRRFFFFHRCQPLTFFKLLLACQVNVKKLFHAESRCLIFLMKFEENFLTVIPTRFHMCSLRPTDGPNDTFWSYKRALNNSEFFGKAKLWKKKKNFPLPSGFFSAPLIAWVKSSSREASRFCHMLL